MKILSLLPNRWSESADIRAMLLTVIVVFGTFALQKVAVNVGDAFLLSGLVAILVTFWVPPIPKERYVRWIVSNSVILIGAFLFLFRVPLAFSSVLGHRAAQVLCILVYGICCWLLIRLKENNSRN